jgi:HD-GYP domain-containing protein (c-di-GMP phosphodiesterase class II)
VNIAIELKHIFAQARKTQRVDLLRIKKIAGVMVDSLEQNNELLLRALHEEDDNVIIHDSINVTVYSILVGKGLNYSQEQLISLATAALVNDIGFIKLPERLLKPDHNLSEKEIELIQLHPVYGAQVVKASLTDKSATEFAWLPKVLLQVHEREGGVGFPQGIKGNEIHEFAKVIGIADTFNALIWEQTYKTGSVTYLALQKIIEMDGRYFSQKIKKALVSQISIFPLGTYVKLNSEQIGVVVDINKSHPTRPVIELLFDSDGAPLPQPERKDLSKSPFLFITRVVSSDEIRNHSLPKN